MLLVEAAVAISVMNKLDFVMRIPLQIMPYPLLVVG